MAVQYNSSDYNVVIPKLPTLPKYQPNQLMSNNTDPSSYYTKALGFLPLDVRYMSNPTNSLAYNSMADVLFNHRAWQERWGRDSWLNTPLGYIPRLIADTALLIKHQTIDPIVQGVIDDGWSGLLRGASTSAMNGLINFGNTADILANPIKGLVIDGGEGFVRGLVGDHNGRKQYDYSDYIDTGNGIADFVLSTGAEILSDPLTYISWGTSSAMKQGARTAADIAQEAVTKAVNTAFKKSAKTVIKRGARSIDDVAAAIVKGTGMDEVAAKAIASSLAEDVVNKTTGVVTKAVTKKSANAALDGLSEQLAKAYTRLGKTPTKQVKATADSIANSLLSGKSTRAKASLFSKGREYTPAQQRVVSAYLKNLDMSKLPTSFKQASAVYKTAENVERILRYAGGVTGLDLLVPVNKGIKRIAGHINNAKARKELNQVIKTVNDFKEELQFKFDNVDNVDTTNLLDEVTINKHTAVFNSLSKRKDTVAERILALSPEKHTAKTVAHILREELDKLNKFIKKQLPREQFSEIIDIDSYINYFKTLNARTGSGAFDSNIKQLELLKRTLTPDVHNPVVLKQYLTGLDSLQAMIKPLTDRHIMLKKKPTDWGLGTAYNKYFVKENDEFIQLSAWPEEWKPDTFYLNRGQEHSMREFRAAPKRAKAVAEKLTEYQTQVDAAINEIVKYSDEALEYYPISKAPKDFGKSGAYHKYYTVDEQSNYIPLTAWPETWESGKFYKKRINNHTTFLDDVVAKAKQTLESEGKPVDLLTSYDDSFKKALEVYTEDPDDLLAKDKLVQAYQDLSNYLYNLNKLSDYNADTIRTSENSFGKTAVSKTSGINTTSLDTVRAYKAVLELEARIKKNPQLNAQFQQLSLLQKEIVEYKNKLNAMLKEVDDESAVAELRTIIKGLQDSYADAEKAFITNIEAHYGPEKAQLFKQRKVADKETKTVINVGSDDIAVRELSDMIEVLPTFNLKALNKVVNLEDYQRYYLNTYVLKTRRANFVHSIIGITDTGAINSSKVTEIEVKHVLKKDAYEYSEFKDLFQILDDAKLLPGAEYVLPGQELFFYQELKRTVRHIFKMLDTDQLDFYSNFLTPGLVPADITSKLKEYFTVILDRITTYMAKNPDAISVSGGMANYLNTLIKVADTGQLPTKRISQLLNLRTQAEHLLYTNIEYLQQFFDTTTKAVSSEGAPLGHLVDVFEDTDSAFYKALTDRTRYSDSDYETVVKPVYDLMVRVKHYRDVVTQLVEVIDARGLGDLYKEAALDSLNTMFSKPIYEFYLDDVMKDFVDGIDLFLKNRLRIESSRMDSVLKTTLDSFKDIEVPAEAQPLIIDIYNSLKEGLAHSAVTDVDNWVRLMHLSKYTNNKQTLGVFDELLHVANGRYIVVFDIETTGAKEVSAVPFQISGKVLDSNGNVVPGSEFNYIIKPPSGVKPLPSVLKKVAPAGVDPDKWWIDNIVNAKTIEGQQIVFENIEDAVNSFIGECNKYTDSGFILAGQNIKNFDIDMLSEYGDNAKEFFKNINKNTDVFDSLDVFNRNTMFQLQGENRELFTLNVKNIFETFMNNDSPLFERQLFAYDDIRNLSNFKKLYTESDVNTDLGLVDVASDGTIVTKTEQGFAAQYADDFGIEDSISEIITTWRTPVKSAGRPAYITVTGLDPNSLENSIKEYLDELAQTGLIDVKPGVNIMQYLNTNVGVNGIILNPKRVLSYEIFDIFDKQKCLDTLTTFGGKSISLHSMYRLTDIMRKIKNHRVYLKQDMVDKLLPVADALLKAAQDSDEAYLKVFANLLYDTPDNLTKVASAIYFYNKADENGLIKNNPAFAQLGDLKEVRRILKTESLGFEPTQIGYSASKTDPITQRPLWIYDDCSYAELAEITSDTSLDKITQFNTEHHLYNIYDAAKHKLHSEDLEFAQRVEACLNEKPKIRSDIEFNIKQYGHALDKAAREEVLTRANRVEAFIAESKLRAGHFYFETTVELDLSDFTKSNKLVVISNKQTPHGTYAHFIGVKTEVFETVEEITQPVRMVKTSKLSDDVFKLVTEGRQRMSRYMKNIGLSRGNELRSETIDAIHDTLRRFGVDDETLALLPDSAYLKSSGYFDTLRPDHSFIGSQEAWQFVNDNPDVFYTLDPLKQLYYNAEAVFKHRNTKLIGFTHLMCNEYSSINTSPVFKDLTIDDKFSLLKGNTEYGVYYIKHTGKWDNTQSGCVVKELAIINKNSIKLAEDLNAYILPRTHAQQLMKAFNTFELPPIANFFRKISNVYKIAYLGSIGFLIRNFIDSNYKTYVGLDGTISLPETMQRFFGSLKTVMNHTEIGKEYTAAMGKYFKDDLEYEVFYKYCKSYNKSNVAELIAAEYDIKYHNRIVRQVNNLTEKFKVEQLTSLQKHLIEPKMFSIVDTFIKSGPSGGLSRSVLDNIATKREVDALQKFNDFMTKDTPLRFVFKPNEYIEQSARLSMFLADLERGSSIDDATRRIITTHFDYSDKSLGMLYTEIVFPFMSFSYKNLEFWLDFMYKNPLLIGQLENIFRPILNYQSVFEPDQEAYESYDYTFDWSKDVWSFQSRAPWTTINAARLYHLLSGNIVIDSGKDVSHNAGYGYKDNDLFYIFKLSPSVLDAVKMLYNPLNAYTERMLPPAEALANTTLKVLNGEAPVDDISVTSLMNMLPYADVIAQRVGLKGNFEFKHNNIGQRISDGGPLMAIGSTFGLAYSPKKTNNFWYDSDYNILGGFKTNYYAKRNYINPYQTATPRYSIVRMSQNKKARDTYSPSKTSRINTQITPLNISRISKNILRNRIKDYQYYL